MSRVTIENLTTLTDFSAIIRAGLYLAGDTSGATDGGFSFRVGETAIGAVKVCITEKDNTKNSTADNFGEFRCY